MATVAPEGLKMNAELMATNSEIMNAAIALALSEYNSHPDYESTNVKMIDGYWNHLFGEGWVLLGDDEGGEWRVNMKDRNGLFIEDCNLIA